MSLLQIRVVKECRVSVHRTRMEVDHFFLIIHYAVITIRLIAKISVLLKLHRLQRFIHSHLRRICIQSLRNFSIFTLTTFLANSIAILEWIVFHERRCQILVLKI